MCMGPNLGLIVGHFIICTVIGARRSYRKWRENKQHLI